MGISLEVIIITTENSKKLDAFLNSLLVQTYLPSKVSIIGDEKIISQYNSFIKEFSLKNIELKMFNSILQSSFQKNIGIKNISNDFVFFTEGNIILDNNYFEASLKFLQSESGQEYSGLTGCQSNFRNNSSLFGKCLNSIFYQPNFTNGKRIKSGFANGINYSMNNSAEVDWLQKSNMLFRKEAFEYNWFDENLQNNSYYDDLDFSNRITAKSKLYYLSDAKFIDCFENINPDIKTNFYFLITNINYVFKKNYNPEKDSKFAHYVSLLGFVIKTLFEEKSGKAFSGAFRGLLEIIFLKNFSLPIYLERLDFSDLKQPSIAEHFVRYEFATTFCEDKLVLDCASGEGIGMNILCKTAKEVHGVDIDENTFKVARENIKYKNAILNLGSATDLPFSDNYFDVITSMETLEHIPQKQQEKCIEEFHRVLKPGGKLIISTPNKSVLNPDGIAPKNYFHLWELTHVEFKDLILRHFKSVETNGLFNPIRQKISLSVNSHAPNKSNLTFKKKILLMLPFSIKNILSIIIYKRKIYPLKSEYVISAENFELSNNLVYVSIK